MVADRPDCRFCSIAMGELAAHIVLDTPEVLAFLDVRPVFPGHVLVIPRPHHGTLTDLPISSVQPFFLAVQWLAGAVEVAMDAHGSFVAVNNTVSQSVAHLHVHVVPRRFKDGLRGFFWPRQPYESEEQIALVAARIRAALEAPTAG